MGEVCAWCGCGMSVVCVQHPPPLHEILDTPLLKWGHFCIQWNSSIPNLLNEDTSVYSGTPNPEMRTPLYTVELLYSHAHPEMRTPLYTVELLYSNTLKWGHLCIQWNSSIPNFLNEDTSVYSGTPNPEMRTPLYTVELLYSNTLKCGHLCIQYSNPLKWGHLLYLDISQISLCHQKNFTPSPLKMETTPVIRRL